MSERSSDNTDQTVVEVGTCDCGNQWVVNRNSTGPVKGCWSCHAALKNDKIRTDQYVRADAEYSQ